MSGNICRCGAYPNIVAAIGDVAHPSWRAWVVSEEWLWLVVVSLKKKLLAGATADAFGLSAAMWLVAGDYSVELGAALSAEACRVLARAGHDARVNEIGHVAARHAAMAARARPAPV